MKPLFTLSFALIFYSLTGWTHSFLPLPSKDLPLGMKANVTEEEFHSIIDHARHFYEKEFSLRGGEMVIYRNWGTRTINAFADRKDNKWNLTFYGGLARHETITPDGFALVVCHEIGHHIGGAPLKSTNRWSSVEGQSDYFAGLKCLRALWSDHDNSSLMQGQVIPKRVKKTCDLGYSQTKDRALCYRIQLAGLSTATLISGIQNEPDPSFDRKDDSVVRGTFQGHPKAQCRLDTYVAASLCLASLSIPLDSENPKVGACNKGDLTGMRPQCWYFEK